MSGDGSVIKRRLKLGNGEFPVDCPVEDTTVRVHYRARKLVLAEGQTVQDASIGGSTAGDDRAEETADWTFDSRLNSGGMPVEFDTGGQQKKRSLSAHDPRRGITAVLCLALSVSCHCAFTQAVARCPLGWSRLSSSWSLENWPALPVGPRMPTEAFRGTCRCRLRLQPLRASGRTTRCSSRWSWSALTAKGTGR